MASVQLGRRVGRDLRAVSRSGDLDLIENEINALRRGVAGLDVKPLEGHRPWLRLRAGDWRILFRPLTAAEVRAAGFKGRTYLVARVVNRRDLEREARRL